MDLTPSCSSSEGILTGNSCCSGVVDPDPVDGGPGGHTTVFCTYGLTLGGVRHGSGWHQYPVVICDLSSSLLLQSVPNLVVLYHSNLGLFDKTPLL